jgi:sulfide:quinone oxidoreductase
MTTEPHTQPFHVLIAGGGVAALEAMMALRALAADRVRITLLAPGEDFHYRPMAVSEPFALGHAARLALADIAGDFDASVVSGSLDRVEPGDCRVVTEDGQRIGYDALVVACGTHTRPALQGALTIDAHDLGDTLRGLVQDVEEGYTREIAFVGAPQPAWPLPLYELALMMARRAYDMNATVELSVVSPERAPLAQFGSAISDDLARLLRDAGIAFHGSRQATLDHGELTLRPGGLRLRPGRVVALPLLEGPRIAGLPADADGFIRVDEFGQVRDLPGVYAAGDATNCPVKHGGIAAQQADVVAESIAARLGVAVDLQPLRPVLRAMLLTGGAPRFYEAHLVGAGVLHSSVSDDCTWQTPGKIVARHLGPYLALGHPQAVGA